MNISFAKHYQCHKRLFGQPLGQAGGLGAMDPISPYAIVHYRLPVSYVESRVFVMPCLVMLAKSSLAG